MTPRSQPQDTTSAASGPRDVLRRVVRQACLTLSADQAFVALRDARDPDTLVIAAAYGGDAEELAGRRFGLEEGLAGRAVTEGKPVILGAGRFTREESSATVRAGAAAPVSAGGRVRGALAVATSDAQREFGASDLEMLEGLADLTAALLTALSGRLPSPQAARRRRAAGEGDRHVLPTALARMERLPALAESRDRLNATLASAKPLNGEAIAAIEADIGLTVAVLRAANEARAAGRAPIAAIPQAVEVLGRPGVELVATRVPVVDFFSHSAPERFRAHALGVQRAAEHLATLVGYPNRDELAVSALLHDVGKLVLAAAYPDEVDAFRADAGAPDARARAEREALGVDHAMVGGVLIRRWGLPDKLAATVERHHAHDADGEAALVRLADMLAHYAHGRPVDPSALLSAARAIGLAPTELRGVLYELPGGGAMRRGVEPSPLTPKEHAALRGLSEGKLYKEIAAQLGVTTSTIRSHLHSSYKKLGAADRAQAVLIATERGWL